MVENADRKVFVIASLEILEQIRNGWSGPIQAHADENADGSWEMTFRTAQGAEQRLIEAAENLAYEVGYVLGDAADSTRIGYLAEPLANYHAALALYEAAIGKAG